MGVNWGDLGVSMVAATGQDKLAAQVEACVEVMRSMNSYRPDQFKVSEGWEPQHTQVINHLHGLEFDQLREKAEAAARLFGKWRVMVTDYEASEATKLDSLAWAVRTLDRVRGEWPAKASLCDITALKIGECLAMDWRVDVPMGGVWDRGWAVRKTRRLDLLPPSWRYV